MCKCKVKSNLCCRRRRRLAGHLFQDRWKDQGRGFILLPPWPPNCLGQMLTVRDFSQHLVSSSKTIRPNIPRGSRCMGHCEMMWSAVCSLAPHSQFARGARPHLYMDEQKRPTPERRRLSLTQAALGRPIPKGLELALGMKAWSDNALAEYSMSHFVFVHSAARTSISERLSSNFRAAGTNERLDFNLSLHSVRPVTLETGHVKCGQGPGSCGWLGRVSLLGGEAQLAGCLKEPEGRPMGWDAGTQWQCARRHLLHCR